MGKPCYILDLYHFRNQSEDKLHIANELKKAGYDVDTDDEGVLIKNRVSGFTWGRDKGTLAVDFEGGKTLIFYFGKRTMSIDILDECITIRRNKEFLVDYSSDGLYIQTEGV